MQASDQTCEPLVSQLQDLAPLSPGNEDSAAASTAQRSCRRGDERAASSFGPRVWLVLAGLAGVLLLSGCNEDAPKASAPVRPVRTQVVSITEWRATETGIGEIKPRYESDLGFRIGGKLARRLVDVGMMVEKSGIVARLDDTNEETAVNIAQSDIIAAKAELDDASAQEQRQHVLLKNGFTTRAAYDNVLRQMKLAQAKFESAQLAKKNAEERLSYTQLASDQAGVVTAVGAEAGQVVAAGQMIVRIARLDAMEAEFQVAEKTLRSVPADAAIEVNLLGDPSIKASGHVREVATTADPVTRTYAVRVALDHPPAELRFGATVQGRVVLQEKKVVELPLSSLFEKNKGPAVWVFDPHTKTVELRPVKLLRYEADKVLITDGLKAGERVVTAGVQKLWPGMKVRLQ